MTTEAVEHLQALGFSEYEGRAYSALLQRGPLTGYQLAKASGIPRPNIYPVLDRLEQRGVVARIQVKGGAKYSPLPAGEVLARLSRNVQSHLENAGRALSEFAAGPQAEYVWNVEGYENLIARAEALADGAQRELLVGVWAAESKQLAAAFARAQARGVEITTLCIQGCPEECGGCRGHIYRYPLGANEEARWLVLAADNGELLVGQVHSAGASGALTRLEVFVTVAAHYVRNTIALAELVRSLGPRLARLVDRDALQALQGAGLATAGGSWFDRMLPGIRAGPS